VTGDGRMSFWVLRIKYVKKKRERRVSLIAAKSILGGAEQWWVLFIVLDCVFRLEVS